MGTNLLTLHSCGLPIEKSCALTWKNGYAKCHEFKQKINQILSLQRYPHLLTPVHLSLESGECPTHYVVLPLLLPVVGWFFAKIAKNELFLGVYTLTYIRLILMPCV